MKKSVFSWMSILTTFITALLYVAILFINGIIFSAEQQPIIVFISIATVFSIFANMTAYWNLIEQSVLESDEIKKAYEEYDSCVQTYIKDAFDFEKVINEEYNASKRLQHKEEIFRKLKSRNLLYKFYRSRISKIKPKITFITKLQYYKNKDKKLIRLNNKLSMFELKLNMKEQVLDLRSTTRSINYKRVSPQSIYSRNGDKTYYANGVNKLGKHKASFMITRIVFSTVSTFFPIFFIFSITGEINKSYIIPIAFGLSAVAITIFQTIMFSRKHTKLDTIDYLSDLHYIIRWYDSFSKSKSLEKNTPPS